MLIVGQPESPPETITVLTFFVNGVASLIGWYSMLNSLDYFAKIYEGYNVYSFFLLAFFIGNIATAIFFR